MPKVQEGSRYKKKYTEEALAKALEKVSKGMSKKAAAKKYGVPRQTIQFRLSNKFQKTSLGPNPVLSLEEENILVDWILDNHRKGFPRRKEDLQFSVKTFLDEKPRPNPFKENMPGDGWYKAFLKRHPLLCERVPEAVTAASSKVSEADIRKWFFDIESYLKEENVFNILQYPDRVFNSDETCFMLCPKNKTVLAPKGVRNVYEVENAPAKSNLTVLFTLAAQGDITPPFIIYPYKRLPASIAESVPDSWGIGISPNGWMKSELFFEYIGNVFHPYLVKKGTQFPVILFVDGHSTHTSYQLSELCRELNIILICLYGNSTRILQPADVSAFKPLKTYWKKGVLHWRREHPTEALTQEKFAPILKTVIENYINSEIIRNGFKTTGLCPWNPNAIDYRKCLGKTQTTKQDNYKHKENTITYSKFVEIIGENLLNKIENSSSDQEQSEEFRILHNIWAEFNKIDNHSVDKEADKNKTKVNEQEEISFPDLNVTSNANELLYEEINIEEIPIIFEYPEVDMPSNYAELSTEPLIATTEPLIATTEPLITTTEPLTENLSASENHSFEMKNMECPLNESSGSIKDYLVWPESPIRKGNRNIERMPFVLTSEAWKKKQLEKKRKKEKEDKEKADRKRKREEKKEQNEKEKKNKKNCSKKKKNARDTSEDMVKIKPNIQQNDSLENFINNNNTAAIPILEEMHKENEEEQLEDIENEKGNSCNTKIKILSNIQIHEAIDRAKKNLFANDEETVEEFAVKGKQVLSGLCYTCAMNINKYSFGYKCSTCLRTYHEKCIKKYRYLHPSADQNFLCKSCTLIKK